MTHRLAGDAHRGIAGEVARILDAEDVVGDSAADLARLAEIQKRWSPGARALGDTAEPCDAPGDVPGEPGDATDDVPGGLAGAEELHADMQWLLRHIGADLGAQEIAPARTMDPGFAEFRDDMRRVSLDWETGSDLYILVTEGLDPGWYTMGYGRTLEWGDEWEREHFSERNARYGDERFSEHEQPSPRTLDAVIDACADFDWAPLVLWTEDAVAELRARDDVDEAVIDRLQAEAAAGRARLYTALRADLAWRRQDLARRVRWIRARFPHVG